MLADVLPLLCCPHCSGALTATEVVVGCPAGHGFDVARQGYLNLLPGDARTGTADTADMVQARADVLAAGHFDPVSDAVAAAVPAGPVVDVGAGTGHHLARVLDRVDGPGLALDLSRHAARRAARAHPRIGAGVADAWRPLPVRDAVAGAVLSVFAPRAPAEAARVLAPGGRLVVATPDQDHLRELVSALGLVTVDPRKTKRLAKQLAAFRKVSREHVRRTLRLTPADVRAVVAMGPSARHLDPAALPQVGRVTTVDVTLSVTVAAYEVAR